MLHQQSSLGEYTYNCATHLQYSMSPNLPNARLIEDNVLEVMRIYWLINQSEPWSFVHVESINITDEMPYKCYFIVRWFMPQGFDSINYWAPLYGNKCL